MADTTLAASPFAVVRGIKVAPPSEETPSPAVVMAYTCALDPEPIATTSLTKLLGSPSAVVRLAKLAPLSFEMAKPPVSPRAKKIWVLAPFSSKASLKAQTLMNEPKRILKLASPFVDR